MSIKKFLKHFVDVYPSYTNPFNYSQHKNLNIGFTIANIYNSKVKYQLKNLTQGNHEVEGTIDPNSHVNVDLTLESDKINPNDLNKYKFEIKATPLEEGPTKNKEGCIQNTDVSISCMPRRIGTGEYDAKIKYDINSEGFNRSFERSESMRFDPDTIEDSSEGDKKLTEEEKNTKREQLIHDEMNRMKKLMDDFQTQFAWGPFRNSLYRDQAIEGQSNKKSLEDKPKDKKETEEPKIEMKVRPAEKAGEKAEKDSHPKEQKQASESKENTKVQQHNAKEAHPQTMTFFRDPFFDNIFRDIDQIESNFFRDFGDFGMRGFGRKNLPKKDFWDDFHDMEQHMNRMFNRMKNFERRFPGTQKKVVPESQSEGTSAPKSH